MLTLTLDQAMSMAGVDSTDTDLERDLKFQAWVGQRKYRVVSDAIAPDPETEILIIKET